jgi:hypothetical protein
MAVLLLPPLQLLAAKPLLLELGLWLWLWLLLWLWLG